MSENIDGKEIKAVPARLHTKCSVNAETIKQEMSQREPGEDEVKKIIKAATLSSIKHTNFPVKEVFPLDPRNSDGADNG